MGRTAMSTRELRRAGGLARVAAGTLSLKSAATVSAPPRVRSGPAAWREKEKGQLRPTEDELDLDREIEYAFDVEEPMAGRAPTGDVE